MALGYTLLIPEKVAVEFRLAGLGSRIMAFLIDLFVMLLISFFIVLFSAIIARLGAYGFAGLSLYLTMLIILFGYHIAFEALWNGQTLGKRALGIRVKMTDGSPLTPGGAFARNILRLADMIPSTYTVGFIAIFFSEKSQRLGDLVANTIVVHETRNVEPVPISSPLSETEHPLEDLVGDLRGMTIEEYLAVKTLCDRFPQLPVRVQDRLSREVWQPIANRYHISSYRNIHPVYLMEAAVMKYARKNGLL